MKLTNGTVTKEITREKTIARLLKQGFKEVKEAKPEAEKAKK